MSKLRAGLIGLGMMGRHHARILASLEGVELVAVFDNNPTPGILLDHSLLVDSLETLISKKVDYCVVAAPTIFHEELGMALASSGIHALIEKPIAANSQAALRLAYAYEKAGLIGAVGHIERHNPALVEAKKRLEEGQLGDIYQVVTRRQGPFPSRISDVGVIKDLATHDIDLTSWLVGKPYERVAAETSFQSGRDHEDFVSAIGLLAEHTITSHVVNWLSPMKERLVHITGEKGALVSDTLTADLTFYANGAVNILRDEVALFRGVREGDVTRYAFSKPEPLRTEHENFRDAVLGLNANIVTMIEGVATVRVAEAMLESSKTGLPVQLR
jgi:UDP-N-acetylglucosamine 3-dehydrogenase